MWIAIWVGAAIGLALFLWGVLQWYGEHADNKACMTLVILGLVLLAPILAVLFIT